MHPEQGAYVVLVCRTRTAANWGGSH